MDHPEFVECFTVPEAAEAMGRDLPTLYRWIAADKIPAPILEAVGEGARVYSVGELVVMARALADHERQWQHLVSAHPSLVEAIHQAVHGYRAEFI